MTTFVIAVATFVPMLVMLIIAHELGHYLTARLFRMKVLEFGLGFPPRLFGIYRGSTVVEFDDETEFGVQGVDAFEVPIYGRELVDARPDLFRRGGNVKVVLWSKETDDGRLVARRVALMPGRKKNRFVAVCSEPDDTTGLLRHEGVLKAADNERMELADMVYSVNVIPLGGFVRLVGEDDRTVPRSFTKSPAWQQFIVLVAGCFVNVLLAVALLTAVPFIASGSGSGDSIRILHVVEDSPASVAGIMPGDNILLPEQGGLEAFQQNIQRSRGVEIEWQVKRDGEVSTLAIVPTSDPAGSGRGWVGIGYAPGGVVGIGGDGDRPNVFATTVRSVELLANAVAETARAVKQGGVESLEVVGPVGLARLTSDASTSYGLVGWMLIAAIISFNLAIVNMLPIPALDGGRALLLGIEVIRGGKPLPATAVRVLQGVSIVVIVALVLAITASDIMNLFTAPR